ncbi:MAG: plasma-membrane proton-efflux P-type ATPase [Candidatus Jordarchaeaceae archaeon]
MFGAEGGSKRFSSDLGLSSEEAKKRLEKYGYNETPEKKVRPIVIFIKKFWGVIPWMLEVTILLTLILGKYFEAVIVLSLLVFNSVIGFIQEKKASGALEFLKQKLSVSSRVKRDGMWILIPAREIVPGDLIRLRSGDFVPADIEVVDGIVEVDQSAVTGESLPVEKRVKDVLHSGSTVKRGEATGIVTSTGANTYFGKTVELVQIAKPKLHMEEVISKVVKWLSVMAAILLLIALLFTVYRGLDILGMVPLMTILIVSVVPVALPTMFTISMALGSLELAKKGVLVTRLSASEDAATMDVLCVDKTGTLTMNKLSIVNILPAGKYTREEVVLYGALASQEANQDPIDLAFLSAAKDMQIPTDSYLQKEFVPFDPSIRRTEAKVEKEGRQFYALKGAINSILPLCKDASENESIIEKSVEEISAKGHRVLAVAGGDSKENLKLVGVVALYDKPRPDSPILISELKSLGVSVKMLTGDALPIAKEVAQELGLGGNIIRKPALEDGLKDENALKVLEESDGFAEVYPEDKYLIVKGLQKGKHIVGMTGDGINDAPALKQAEVGVAVNNATDVAKESASLVLTAPGLEGIVESVKNGRKIYQRITTYILNKIVKTFQVLVFIVLAFLLTGKYVVSLFSMVLLLFLVDFVTLSISTDNVRYSLKPDRWNVTSLVKISVSLGLVMIAESMLLLYLGEYLGLYNNIGELYTFVFDMLIFIGLFNVLIIRERQHFWKSKPSKPLITSIMADTLIVILISTFGLYDLAPIGALQTLTVLIYSLAMCFLVNDYAKVFLAKTFGL